MNIVKHYKPNVVYILLIDDNYYVGCHTVSGAYLTNNYIISTSNNYLAKQVVRREISRKEYFSRVSILNVEEFDSKQEALEREVELITYFKTNYPTRCVNQADGNMHGNRGVVRTPEWNYGCGNACRGKHRSLETKLKISKAHLGKKMPEEAVQKKYKPVIQIDMNTGEILNSYTSVREAKQSIVRGDIGACLQGRTKQAGGYMWRYA